VAGLYHYPCLEGADAVTCSARSLVTQRCHRRAGLALYSSKPRFRQLRCGLHPSKLNNPRPGRFLRHLRDPDAFALAATWLGWQPQVEKVGFNRR